LIAIGPGAAQEIDVGHHDLDLFEVTILDGNPTSTRELQPALDALGRALLDSRFAVACLFDARDESWWPVASSVAMVIADRASPIRLFVCSDSRPSQRDRVAMFGRLSRHLDSCVIDAPQEPGGLLRAALLPLIGLVRTGVVGFDPADLAMLLRSPSVGHVAFANGRRVLGDDSRDGIIRLLGEPDVSDVLLAIRCDAETTLHEINAICTRVVETAPEANVMIATPSGDLFNVGILALREYH